MQTAKPGIRTSATDRSSAPFQARKAIATLALIPLISACSMVNLGRIPSQRLAEGEVATPIGAMVRNNRTPMEGAIACFADHLTAMRKSNAAGSPVISVGDIKDFTGKYSINEGNAVTQGGSLMVYSALGKLNGVVRIAERFDSAIAERELGYMDRRQLGDGRAHDVSGQRVPWVPYFGGTIAQTDFYIVGGITEVNYNIRSGGAEFGVDNIGAKSRVFNQSIAVDLRIVNARTLMVERTVSLTKQFAGYEVGLNVFRFFGKSLFDVNIGAKGQEPLQLGIRAALEEATLKLVGAATGVDPEPCLELVTSRIPDQSAEEMRGQFLQVWPPKPLAGRPFTVRGGVEVADNAPYLNALGNSPARAANIGANFQILFEFGDVSIIGPMQTVLDQIAAEAAKGPVVITIVSRDTENWDPAKRDSLLEQRLAVLNALLSVRGVSPAATKVTWRPVKNDSSMQRIGAGLQYLARVQVN